MKWPLTIFMAIFIVILIFSDTYEITGKRTEANKGRWFVGRISPSRFEYSAINQFCWPKKAIHICEADLQCAGFTFKGTKTVNMSKPEIYFFHFVNENDEAITTKIRYPHWSSYIVSRHIVLINASYEILPNDNVRVLER